MSKYTLKLLHSGNTNYSSNGVCVCGGGGGGVGGSYMLTM